jgi:hypothetical protein
MTKLKLIVFLFTLNVYNCSVIEQEDDNGIPPKSLAEQEIEKDYNFISSGATTITLSGDKVTILGTGASYNGGVVDITSSGQYIITGTLSDGQIRIATSDNTDAVKIQLDNAKITNTKGSALFIKDAIRAIINLKENTINTIEDGNTYRDTDGDQNAALFSQKFLAIYGEGSLVVKGNYQDGITSKDGLLIKSSHINVTAKDDAIRGKDFLVVRSSKIIVNSSAGDGLKSDLDGFSDFGYIQIDDVDLTVESQGDGISAVSKIQTSGGKYSIKTGGGSTKTISTDLSAKGMKSKLINIEGTTIGLDVAEDGIHSDDKINIGNSTIMISAADDGIRGTNNVTIIDSKFTITKSYEGVEGYNLVFSNSIGDLVSSNDCFNATKGVRVHSSDGSTITINEGTYVLNGLSGDPLDSNGSISMNGGTVIIHGPSKNPEVPIDYNGSFELKKGTVVASSAGTQMLQTPEAKGNVVTIKAIFVGQQPAETIYGIKDNNNKTIFAFKPARSYVAMIVSSDLIKAGNTYTITSGGQASGATLGGLFNTLEGGQTRATITLKPGLNAINL